MLLNITTVTIDEEVNVDIIVIAMWFIHHRHFNYDCNFIEYY